MDKTRHDDKDRDICRFTLEYCYYDSCENCDKRAKSLIERMRKALVSEFVDGCQGLVGDYHKEKIDKVFSKIKKQEMLV